MHFSNGPAIGVMDTARKSAASGTISDGHKVMRPLLPQLIVFFAILVVRFVVRTHSTGGAAIGPLFGTVQRSWATMQGLARSPQAAPFVMALLIIGTKLVTHFEGRGAVELVEAAGDQPPAFQEAEKSDGGEDEDSGDDGDEAADEPEE